VNPQVSATSRTLAPPVRLFTDQEARTFDEHHQQVLFIKNRILNLLEVSNVAARHQRHTRDDERAKEIPNLQGSQVGRSPDGLQRL
jgi:prophage antirepressor-like protein